MPSVDSSMVRAQFTVDMIAYYKGYMKPTNFLSGHFKRAVKSTLYLNYDVRRAMTLAADDVVRGADGNRNDFALGVQKTVLPPFFYEFLDVTQLLGFQRAFGTNMLNESIYNDFITEVMEHIDILRNKIDLRYELQASEIFQTGTVTSKSNPVENFLRRSDSMIAYDASINFADNTINPVDLLERLVTYVQTIGQYSGGEFNLIFGKKAWAALRANTNIQNESQKLWKSTVDFKMPTDIGAGAKHQGVLSLGSYAANCYTYPQFYNSNPADRTVFTPYIPDNMVLCLPNKPMFIHGFAQVPKLPESLVKSYTSGGNFGSIGGSEDGTTGQYFIEDFIDQRKSSWFYAIKSAGLCIPVAVDQIANAYVLAP